MDQKNALKGFAEFRKEVYAMSGIRHPNIVVMHGFCAVRQEMNSDYHSPDNSNNMEKMSNKNNNNRIKMQVT